MQHIIQKNNRTFILMTILFFTIMAFLAVTLYQWQIEKAKSQEFEFFQSSLDEKIEVLIEEKKNTLQAIGLALSSPIDFHQALLNKDVTVRAKLKALSARFKDLSAYKDIWIQLIDAEGNSLARSWTDKHGDNLVGARKEIASMLRNPRSMNTLSVGKFALTFKSMEPLYDEQHRLIGILDVISQVNSIEQVLLKSKGARSIVLVDKRFRHQLKNPYTGKFVGDYYVANMNANPSDMLLVKQLGADDLIDEHGYQVFEDTLIVSHPILDVQGDVMANWLTLESLKNFNFVNMQKTQRQIILIFAFIILLLLFLVVMIYLKRQVDFEKKLFFEVFNSSSEIVYLTDRKRLLYANKRFFDTFNFKTLEEFHTIHSCVCEMFVKEEGFLEELMGQAFWYDYVSAHPELSHYAKIIIDGKAHVFQVKASEISNAFGKEYISILMSDITEEEDYKSKLEHLIIHDELTGIYNRHYFNQYLEEEIYRHQRYQSPFSILAIDIDLFKRVNDQYGHDVGDLVLINIANTMKSLIRESDVLCRIGGEEFVVMMPETSLKNASKVAEKLREGVASVTSAEVPESLTISIGLTELTHWDSAQSFYKRADKLLYLAKDSGRNQVVASLEEESQTE